MKNSQQNANSFESAEKLADVFSNASELKKQKDHQGLIGLLEPCLEKLGDTISLCGMLGDAYLNTGDYDSAEKILSDLVSRKNAPYWINVSYANVLEKQESHSEAAENFCIALDRKYSCELGCRAARLIEYSPEPDLLYENIVSIVEQIVDEQFELAQEFCKIADYLLKNGNTIIAIDFYKESIFLDGEIRNTHLKKAVAQIRCEKYEDAKTSLESLKELGLSRSGSYGLDKIVDHRAQIHPYLKDLRSIFLPEYYRREYSLEKLNNSEAFQHFLSKGMLDSYKPNPWFDHDYFNANFDKYVKDRELPIIAYIRLEHTGLVKPSEYFNPVFYRNHHNDIKDMHVTLGHYVQYGHREGRLSMNASLPVNIVDEFHEMIDIEPRLVAAAEGLGKIERYPRVRPSMFVPGIVREKLSEDIKAVVCVPFVSRGGADLVATYCVKALQSSYGKKAVMLIVTDASSVEVADWLDDETQIVVLEGEASFHDLEEKADVLHKVIGQYSPDLIMNVNSKACWEMYQQYGRQLSTVTSLYAYLFCYDYDVARNRVGYITEYLANTIGNLKAILFDNKHIVEDVKSHYRFSKKNVEKISPLYSPYLGSMAEYSPLIEKEGVLWVGRMSIQKRPDILVSIANALPYIKFYVYGTPGNSEYSQKIISGQYRNIIYKGTFTEVGELKIEKYAMFLHNSEWEGIPTVLITMMANSIPIVTSDVGGVSELVTDTTGWVVKDFEDVDEYCLNISKVFLQPDETICRVKAGYELVKEQHNWRAYVEGMESIGIVPEYSSEIYKPCKEIA